MGEVVLLYAKTERTDISMGASRTMSKNKNEEVCTEHVWVEDALW